MTTAGASDPAGTPRVDAGTRQSAEEFPRPGSLRRWWPAFVAAAAACLLVLVAVAVRPQERSVLTAQRSADAIRRADEMVVVEAEPWGFRLANQGRRVCLIGKGPTDVVVHGPGGSREFALVPGNHFGATTSSDAVTLPPGGHVLAGFLPTETLCQSRSADAAAALREVYDTVDFTAAPGLRMTAHLEPPVTGTTCGGGPHQVVSTWDGISAVATAEPCTLALARGRSVPSRVAYVPGLPGVGYPVGDAVAAKRVVPAGGSYYASIVQSQGAKPCRNPAPGDLVGFDVGLGGGFGVLHADLPSPVAVPACVGFSSNQVSFTP